MNEIIDYVKKNIKQIVQDQAISENIYVSASLIENIINNLEIDNISKSDYNTIVNLLNGWDFILNTIDEEITFEKICLCNSIVSNEQNPSPGLLRKSTVYVTTGLAQNYYPPIPNELEIREKLYQINQIDNILDRGLLCKTQIFEDGNKRTASFITSQLFLKHGLAIIKPPINNIIDDGKTISILMNNDYQYKKQLVNYYVDDDQKQTLKDFLVANCLFSNNLDEIREDSTYKVDTNQAYDLLKINKNDKIDKE